MHGDYVSVSRFYVIISISDGITSCTVNVIRAMKSQPHVVSDVVSAALSLSYRNYHNMNVTPVSCSIHSLVLSKKSIN